jgi:hypothetical protein
MKELVPFASLLGNATQIALLMGAVSGLWLLGRRLRSALAGLAAACALLPCMSNLARLAALRVFASAGGAEPNAVSYLPLQGMRYVAVGLVAVWLVRLVRSDGFRVRSLAVGATVGACIVATPWALGPLTDRLYIANVQQRHDWESRLSTRASPRWLERRTGELPTRFTMGLAVDGLYDRAWACGVDSMQRVVCWHPEREQLEPEVLAEGVVDVSVGWGRACAVDARGCARCWSASGGELPVPALCDAVAVQVDIDGYVCAQSSGVDCFDGPPRDSGPWALNTPDVRLVAVGYLHGACVTTGGDGAWCWDRSSAQMAKGVDVLRSPGVRVPAPALADAVGIAASAVDVCAVRGDGTVICLDEKGRQTEPPVRLTDVAQVAVAEDHICARTRAGRVVCWGDDQWGQSDEADVDDARWIAVTLRVTCTARTRGIECRGRGMVR